MLHPLFNQLMVKVAAIGKPHTHETEKLSGSPPKTKQQDPKTDEHASSLLITKTGFPRGFSDNSKLLTIS